MIFYHCPRNSTHKYVCDIAIKLGITLLVCIALCYSCFYVESERTRSGRGTVKKLQQAQKEKFTQMDARLDAAMLLKPIKQVRTASKFPAVRSDDANDIEGSGSAPSPIPDATTELEAFGDPSNAMAKIRGAPLVDFAPLNEHPMHVQKPDTDKERQTFKRFLDSEATPDLFNAGGQLNDIFKLTEEPEAVPFVRKQTVEVISDDMMSDNLFLTSHSMEQWDDVPAALSAEERYFPGESYFEAGSIDSSNKESSEEYIVTDFDNGDFMELESQPIAATTTSWEGVLESLFGKMAEIITPIQQMSRSPQLRYTNTIGRQHQGTQNADQYSDNWIKKFSC